MIVAIIQARMNSTRLPGKVLRPIAGKPMLWHVLQRVRASPLIEKIVVATSENKSDTPIRIFCEKERVPCFSGSENDVLDRYYQACKFYSADPVIRLTADCPLLDPIEIDRLLDFFLAHPELDYVATGRTYPEGYGVEVLKRTALEKAWSEAKLASEREHVTPYIWKHPNYFRIKCLELTKDLSHFRVTVDEEVDLKSISVIVDALGSQSLFGIGAVIDFLQACPEVALMNNHIPRQAGYWKSVVEDEFVSKSPLS